MALSFNTLVKPEKWDLSPELVDTLGRTLWRGLTHCFPMWEGGGATIANVVSGLNEGVLSGCSWAIDPTFGRVLVFDGTANDQVSLGTVPAVAQGSILSVFRLKTKKTVTRLMGSDDDHEIILRGGADDQIGNDLYAAGGTDLRSSTGSIAIDTWYNLICTWHFGTTSQEIYIDGVLDASSGLTGNDDPVPVSAWLLGHRTGSAAGEHFDGRMAIVAKWDRVLTAHEAYCLARDPFALVRSAPTRIVASTVVAPPTTRRIMIDDALIRVSA